MALLFAGVASFCIVGAYSFLSSEKDGVATLTERMMSSAGRFLIDPRVYGGPPISAEERVARTTRDRLIVDLLAQGNLVDQFMIVIDDLIDVRDDDAFEAEPAGAPAPPVGRGAAAGVAPPLLARGAAAGPAVPPTSIQAATTRMVEAASEGAFAAFGHGVVTRLGKPREAIKDIFDLLTSQEPAETELDRAIASRGLLRTAALALPYMADPEKFAVLAKAQAEMKVAEVRAKVENFWPAVWKGIWNAEIKVPEISKLYRTARDNVKKANHNLKSVDRDSRAFVNATHNYWLNYKIYEYLGGIGAGIGTAFLVKRTLGKASEARFGPAFTRVARAVEAPMNVATRLASAGTIRLNFAPRMGAAMARSLPGVLLMTLTAAATLGRGRRELRESLTHIAENCPALKQKIIDASGMPARPTS